MNEENEKVQQQMDNWASLLKLTLFPPQYLAILFFLNDYHKSSLRNLPGVVHDEKELSKVLKNYQKKVIKNSEDVLKDLRNILQDFKQKEFERIHFHFSGNI